MRTDDIIRKGMHYSPNTIFEEVHCTFKPLVCESLTAPVTIHLYTKDNALPSRHEWWIQSDICHRNRGFSKRLADASSVNKIKVNLDSNEFIFEELFEAKAKAL